MDKGKWKMLAMVFICLFILETIIFATLYSIGANVIEQENKCATGCVYDEGFNAYVYTEGNCYCVDSNGKYEMRMF